MSFFCPGGVASGTNAPFFSSSTAFAGLLGAGFAALVETEADEVVAYVAATWANRAAEAQSLILTFNSLNISSLSKSIFSMP
jgi:hypothetical protein